MATETAPPTVTAETNGAVPPDAVPPADAPPADAPVLPLPALSEGFVRLGDVVGTPRANDPCAALRALVGKDLEIDACTIAKDLKSGTANVHPYGEDVDSITVPVPVRSIRKLAGAIAKLAADKSEAKIVVHVVQTGRGVAFR